MRAVDEVKFGADAPDVVVCWFVVIFFFQAEDGIRDHCVTGVQTCALPISRPSRPLVATSRLTIAGAKWGHKRGAAAVNRAETAVSRSGRGGEVQARKLSARCNRHP